MAHSSVANIFSITTAARAVARIRDDVANYALTIHSNKISANSQETQKAFRQYTYNKEEYCQSVSAWIVICILCIYLLLIMWMCQGYTISPSSRKVMEAVFLYNKRPLSAEGLSNKATQNVSRWANLITVMGKCASRDNRSVKTRTHCMDWAFGIYSCVFYYIQCILPWIKYALWLGFAYENNNKVYIWILLRASGLYHE